MASERRIGAPDAKNRAVLLDAAERILLNEGYPAVTSRKVAAEAGLKSQLVHYYFQTMDDLFLEVFRRRAEEGLVQQQELAASDRPLRALWEFNSDPTATAFFLEFGALCNRRGAIRAEVARYSELFRTTQLEVVDAFVRRYRIPPEVCVPMELVVRMTAVARVMAMESSLELSTGHAEAVEHIENYLDELESYADAEPAARRRARKTR
ncbi:TetR/AcrR family transcriptional regulator [Saccharopolyspora sp. HNM0983]|uniref:TetR/AcrR family transcriptional regulator n=1 Tax=Saccharopolyspora montiporae TaxID=2781240 RepID=A0A929FYB8_9PSEU|nr:TetR/AcrR family transcriptional regulator [Saccharopolyspora sp. HNM0983]MBE9373325.1 TetR/AcrR family transcriptional regulator [Saccharopolyspora sp. HNM0983]